MVVVWWEINKGLNLKNGKETKKGGVTWKQKDTRVEEYSKILYLLG